MASAVAQQSAGAIRSLTTPLTDVVLCGHTRQLQLQLTAMQVYSVSTTPTALTLACINKRSQRRRLHLDPTHRRLRWQLMKNHRCNESQLSHHPL